MRTAGVVLAFSHIFPLISKRQHKMRIGMGGPAPGVRREKNLPWAVDLDIQSDYHPNH
jgi:hypothetical protein